MRPDYQDQVSLVESTLEDVDSEFDMGMINVSMHQCKEIEKVTKNVHSALKPGGFSSYLTPRSRSQPRSAALSLQK